MLTVHNTLDILLQHGHEGTTKLDQRKLALIHNGSIGFPHINAYQLALYTAASIVSVQMVYNKCNKIFLSEFRLIPELWKISRELGMTNFDPILFMST